jgi:prepilin-type N-terminal cleavage/methylation domain-containing protein
MRKLSNKGFTIIELLVVIAIIGLLSTLAVVALKSALAKSRDAKRLADVKQIQAALELYFADQAPNAYPTGAGIVLGKPAANALCKVAAGFQPGPCAAGVTTYMGLVPRAPERGDGGLNCSTARDEYLYNPIGSGAAYTINFCLGSDTGNLKAGSRTADPNGIR